MKDNWDVEIYVFWLLEYQRLAFMMKDNLGVRMSAGPVVSLRSSGCCSLPSAYQPHFASLSDICIVLFSFPLNLPEQARKQNLLTILQELENS